MTVRLCPPSVSVVAELVDSLVDDQPIDPVFTTRTGNWKDAPAATVTVGATPYATEIFPPTWTMTGVSRACVARRGRRPGPRKEVLRRVRGGSAARAGVGHTGGEGVHCADGGRISGVGGAGIFARSRPLADSAELTGISQFPGLGGHEGGGEVLEVGAGVTYLAVGDHVV